MPRKKPVPTEPTIYSCAICNVEIPNPNAIGVDREVLGWVEARKDGGANAVKFSKNTGRFAHKPCIDLLKWSDRAKQESLLG